MPSRILCSYRLPLAALASLAIFFSPPGQAVEAGGDAPNFALQGNNGKVEINSFRGNVIYLDFWASWCAPCRSSFPWMNEMQEKYAGQGLRVVGVNLDTSEEVAKQFLRQVPAKFAIAFDGKGETPVLYNVKGMPTSILIDRNGRVISTHMGFNKDSREKLEKSIQDALKGQP